MYRCRLLSFLEVVFDLLSGLVELSTSDYHQIQTLLLGVRLHHFVFCDALKMPHTTSFLALIPILEQSRLLSHSPPAASTAKYGYVEMLSREGLWRGLAVQKDRPRLFKMLQIALTGK